MRSPRNAPAGAGRGTGTRREVLVVLLVGVVVLVTALAGPPVLRWHEPPRWLYLSVTPPPPMTGGPTPAADLSNGAAQHPLPAWLTQASKWLAVAALGALAFVLLRYVVRLLRDRWRAIDPGGPGGEAGGVEALDELDDITQAALDTGVAQAGRALRADLPPGDAVIAAWLALEHAAESGGIVRGPAQTATEFTLALLDRTPADPAAARTLLGLYHRARFSDHEVRPSDVSVAAAALDVLAAALARAAPPGPGPGPGAAS